MFVRRFLLLLLFGWQMQISLCGDEKTGPSTDQPKDGCHYDVNDLVQLLRGLRAEQQQSTTINLNLAQFGGIRNEHHGHGNIIFDRNHEHGGQAEASRQVDQARQGEHVQQGSRTGHPQEGHSAEQRVGDPSVGTSGLSTGNSRAATNSRNTVSSADTGNSRAPGTALQVRSAQGLREESTSNNNRLGTCPLDPNIVQIDSTSGGQVTGPSDHSIATLPHGNQQCAAEERVPRRETPIFGQSTPPQRRDLFHFCPRLGIGRRADEVHEAPPVRQRSQSGFATQRTDAEASQLDRTFFVSPRELATSNTTTTRTSATATSAAALPRTNNVTVNLDYTEAHSAIVHGRLESARQVSDDSNVGLPDAQSTMRTELSRTNALPSHLGSQASAQASFVLPPYSFYFPRESTTQVRPHGEPNDGRPQAENLTTSFLVFPRQQNRTSQPSRSGTMPISANSRAASASDDSSFQIYVSHDLGRDHVSSSTQSQPEEHVGSQAHEGNGQPQGRSRDNVGSDAERLRYLRRIPEHLLSWAQYKELLSYEEEEARQAAERGFGTSQGSPREEIQRADGVTGNSSGDEQVDARRHEGLRSAEVDVRQGVGRARNAQHAERRNDLATTIAQIRERLATDPSYTPSLNSPLALRTPSGADTSSPTLPTITFTLSADAARMISLVAISPAYVAANGFQMDILLANHRTTPVQLAVFHRSSYRRSTLTRAVLPARSVELITVMVPLGRRGPAPQGEELRVLEGDCNTEDDFRTAISQTLSFQFLSRK